LIPLIFFPFDLFKPIITRSNILTCDELRYILDPYRQITLEGAEVRVEVDFLSGEYEGLEKIAKHFASETHLGPKFVADFEELTDLDAREVLQRDAYEKVSYLLKNLGIV